ncbi:N-acetylmuramoyl-L-alanine amidase [Sphaerospermopsis aphanizomenoides BCCUSP55]|uniref:peptidoglycan recognition protein family protein n=1 Tax=Sphaerospermopsis aphanizomenoides TaxID=459663 RepID=UPI0019088687|nr:peptidoglycan recognition family protein [Sphaerospermopsis aphanizomenoides]MBK1986096.1 N-acetylmuramoyl-L-alanine amidase [Sphaerospermopsis aphanizomenoides BCCUSP55]
MRFRDWATRVMFIFFLFASLILAVFIGGSRQTQSHSTASHSETTVGSQYPQAQFQSIITQAENKQNLLKAPVNNQNKIPKIRTQYTTTVAFSQYKPKLAQAEVDPSNYGERYTTDVNGVRVSNQPMIVLHETTNSASSAVNFFQTPHDDEDVQASYHALIALDGTVIYLVPPDKRAFGAGNSVFKGANGVETVQTNPKLPPSVNNFAYHVSLETPPDAWGKSNIEEHSGYTEAQYNSLAWLIAQSQVPDDRITTHRAVDIGNGKVDPLSFDFDKFFNKLHSFRELRTVNTAKR